MSIDPISQQLHNSLIIGGDDGYDSLKFRAYYKGRTAQLRLPSLLAPGAPSRLDLDGSETDLFGYDAIDADTGEQKTFSVGVDQRGLIRTDQQDFMISAGARVLLYHGIRCIAKELDYNESDPVFVMTGLPVETFYIGNKRNVQVIERKLSNLRPDGFAGKPVVAHGKGLCETPTPTFIGCGAEAVAAWYGLSLDVNLNTMKPEVNAINASLKVVVIDWGGRTIDIIPMHQGAPDFTVKRSIHDKGGMYLARKLEQFVKLEKSAEIKYLDRLEYRHYRQALISGTLTIFGATYDVTAQRTSAIKEYALEIAPELFAILEGMTDYTHCLFVGGPVELLLEQKGVDWFPPVMERCKVPEDIGTPYMNAYGLCAQALQAATLHYKSLLQKESA